MDEKPGQGVKIPNPNKRSSDQKEKGQTCTIQTFLAVGYPYSGGIRRGASFLSKMKGGALLVDHPGNLLDRA